MISARPQPTHAETETHPHALNTHRPCCIILYLKRFFAPFLESSLRHESGFVVLVLPMGVEALFALDDAQDGDERSRLFPNRVDAPLQHQK